MKLTIGTTLIIETNFTETTEHYKCRVVEIDEDSKYFMIDYPIHISTKKTAFFIEGAQLHVNFTENTNAAYAFKTEILGRVRRNIPMIKLSYPGDEQLIKIQRREFVRVETPVDVSVNFHGGVSQFVADDISAGGMAILLDRTVHFKENDVIDLLVVLPFANGDLKYVKTAAHVIRIVEKAGKQVASLQFDGIEDTDRQYIVRFCFERQLLNRKKGTV
jgi:c-di-GMP-binding flagellar brake protein YcgR